jgi:hypothetical protein
MGQVELHQIACPQCNARAVEFLGKVPLGAMLGDVSADKVLYTFRCAAHHYFNREFTKTVTITVSGSPPPSPPPKT